ncbi:MAG: hypothetical protein H6727_07500 [Myxococcales bacterium]|nr:hypothetical protein [Myxococcales bacterium]
MLKKHQVHRKGNPRDDGGDSRTMDTEVWDEKPKEKVGEQKRRERGDVEGKRHRSERGHHEGVWI